MVNQQVLEGNWNEVSGKLKKKWGQLSDDELSSFKGNVEQLVGAIQRKTGESRQAIEDFLGEVSDGASNVASAARDRLHSGANYAADAARHGYDTLRHGYDEAQRTVKRRPAQSVAVAFGLGFAAGVGLAVMLRDRPAPSRLGRGRAATEKFGRQVLDALGEYVPHR